MTFVGWNWYVDNPCHVWASVLVGDVPCRALTVIVVALTASIGTSNRFPIGSVARGYDAVPPPP